jgi:hypothetical protein
MLEEKKTNELSSSVLAFDNQLKVASLNPEQNWFNFAPHGQPSESGRQTANADLIVMSGRQKLATSNYTILM